MTQRRGFTLVELLVGMVLLTLVGAVTYGVLVNMQRTSRRQTEQSQLQDNVRSGAMILPAELREIGYDAAGTDLVDIGTNQVQFRAMRGVAFTCNITGTTLYVYRTGHTLYRTPTANDRLLYFVEKQQSIALDDEWIPLTISSVDVGATCPGSVPAIGLTLTSASQTTLNPFLASVFIGGPVRVYEEIQMGLYSTDGRSWLGARSVSDGENSYQPVLGPLADVNGVEFKYYNAANTVVAANNGNRGVVRSIEVTLRGRSDQAVRVQPGAPQNLDLTLRTRVALRNTLRP